ncbi:Cobalt import ATP-binding protein CbiO [Leclercia adecarboxylata]|uniref:Cobalt import ATP-binding protein CbiO n=1 Tax=Leclercia adecarboxylata TaxID=83655 RepID=A0A4U9HWJ9_9ENTR|nr:Cobalt import ATP-binding protein CbiO [Leclercia adecarboxylata]
MPWFWWGTQHFAWALVLIVLVPGLLALLFGWFAFRSKIKGVYFSIMTQALTFAGMLLFFRNETGFGGNNGFTGFTTLLGFSVTATSTRIALFLATVLLLAASLAVGYALAKSKFGRILTAVRDAENRLTFCGYDPRGFKLLVWTLSAVLCGLAGALYVPQVGIINPGEMSPTNSIEAAIWVALGGRGTLIGPVIGRRAGQRRKKRVHRGDAGVLAAVSWADLYCRHAVFTPRRNGSVSQGRAVMSDQLFTRQLPGDRYRDRTDPVLQLENINVSFDGFKALTDLSLNIGVGELRCVIGPNGAGKTTLMDVITGKTRPQSGRALYDQSTDLTTLDPIAIARQGIGSQVSEADGV